MTTGDSLITLQEAEEVARVPTPQTKQLRTLLMVVFGALLVVVATILIFILISLFNPDTGWRSILPFLESKPLESLQIN